MMTGAKRKDTKKLRPKKGKNLTKNRNRESSGNIKEGGVRRSRNLDQKKQSRRNL